MLWAPLGRDGVGVGIGRRVVGQWPREDRPQQVDEVESERERGGDRGDRRGELHAGDDLDRDEQQQVGGVEQRIDPERLAEPLSNPLRTPASASR